MRRVRGRLVGIAAITLSVYVAVASLGALCVCWGTEHRHGGSVADHCAMHGSGAPVSGPETHHGHHEHQGHKGKAVDHQHPHDYHDGTLTCHCSNHSASPYVGPPGVLPPAIAWQFVMLLSLATTPRDETPVEMAAPPLSPPPRSLISVLS